MTDGQNKEYGWMEAKMSGGSVFEQGVKQSKESTSVVFKSFSYPSEFNTPGSLIPGCKG